MVEDTLLRAGATVSKINIVGIQESRYRGENYFAILDYHVLPGAATPAGHGGVQI